ncbi:hypothetical protein Tco_0001618 [Tanacetum coccineum]
MGCAETKVATWDDLSFKLIILRYRIFTKGQKQSQTEQNRARNWKEREKPRPKVQKGLKTVLKRIFPDRLDNVCAFNEVKTKSKSTPGYGIGKGMENELETLS